MQLLVLALCLVGQSLALPMTTMDPNHDHAKPCCMPKRWQAVLLDLNSDTAMQYATVYAYDADMKTEGSLTVRIDDETPVYWSFTDYNTMKTYNVAMYGDPSTHKCTQAPASHKFYDHCFLGKDSMDASMTAPKLLAESVWGPVTGGIPFHAWSLKLDSMDITIGLSTDECVPLVESVRGMNNGKMLNSIITFNDFTTNLTSPELLSLPPACITTS